LFIENLEDWQFVFNDDARVLNPTF